MVDPSLDNALIEQARDGGIEAKQQLLQVHRERLKRMVAVRLDNRLTRRIDPSDIVQEALTEAAQKLEAYLVEMPVPFYVWLRSITWERLVKTQQHHLGVQKRSVAREQWSLSDESVLELAQLIGHTSTPSEQLIQEELRERVRGALLELGERDQEILILRYLEQLSLGEVSEVLQISEGAVKQRQLRALRRLRDLLTVEGEETEQ